MIGRYQLGQSPLPGPGLYQGVRTSPTCLPGAGSYALPRHRLRVKRVGRPSDTHREEKKRERRIEGEKRENSNAEAENIFRRRVKEGKDKERRKPGVEKRTRKENKPQLFQTSVSGRRRNPAPKKRERERERIGGRIEDEEGWGGGR